MDTEESYDLDFATPDLDLLPPESLLAPNSAVNDQYLRDIAALKRLIVTQTLAMPPAHVEICKLRHVGKKTAYIAETVDLTAITVNRTLRSEKGQRLLALMAHLTLLNDGPREGQRRAMLWRIAQKNEDPDPRTAISAISELNRMHFQAETINQGGITGNVVQIVINNDNFPRGALD